ncbi:hypothetical protein WA158_004627 [Blastocystis sp. Blastoise]
MNWILRTGIDYNGLAEIRADEALQYQLEGNIEKATESLNLASEYLRAQSSMSLPNNRYDFFTMPQIPINLFVTNKSAPNTSDNQSESDSKATPDDASKKQYNIIIDSESISKGFWDAVGTVNSYVADGARYLADYLKPLDKEGNPVDNNNNNNNNNNISDNNISDNNNNNNNNNMNIPTKNDGLQALSAVVSHAEKLD